MASAGSAGASPPTTKQAAQDLITKTTQDYIATLRALKPEDFGRTVQLPFGEWPLPQACGMPVMDLVHHHGQIAYIQTLLGDAEDHFLNMG